MGCCVECGIRTLESHVLEEVGGSVGAICLGARAGVDPDTDSGGLSRRVGLGSDSKTVGEGGGLGDGLARDSSGQVAKVESSGGGRNLLGSGEPQSCKIEYMRICRYQYSKRTLLGLVLGELRQKITHCHQLSLVTGGHALLLQLDELHLVPSTDSKRTHLTRQQSGHSTRPTSLED